MPRKPLILSSTHLFHITNRSNNREWFYVPPAEAWQIFCAVLRRAIELYEFEIRCFVLMSNHYHLILRTPKMNLGDIIRYLQTETARAIQRSSGRMNHVFGTRYKWSLLWNDSAVAYAYKYVARNPVVAGLSKRVEDYPYSTVHETHNLLADCLPVVESVFPPAPLLPRDWDERLKWLNLPSPRELDGLISKALRRPVFGFSKGNEVRKRLLDLSAAYGIVLPPEIPATFSAEK